MSFAELPLLPDPFLEIVPDVQHTVPDCTHRRYPHRSRSTPSFHISPAEGTPSTVHDQLLVYTQLSSWLVGNSAPGSKFIVNASYWCHFITRTALSTSVLGIKSHDTGNSLEAITRHSSREKRSSLITAPKMNDWFLAASINACQKE